MVASVARRSDATLLGRDVDLVQLDPAFLTLGCELVTGSGDSAATCPLARPTQSLLPGRERSLAQPPGWNWYPRGQSPVGLPTKVHHVPTR